MTPLQTASVPTFPNNFMSCCQIYGILAFSLDMIDFIISAISLTILSERLSTMLEVTKTASSRYKGLFDLVRERIISREAFL